MAFLIAYRDLRHPDTVGTRVVSGELEVREAIGRLDANDPRADCEREEAGSGVEARRDTRETVKL
jgi:hypothetical protein